MNPFAMCLCAYALAACGTEEAKTSAADTNTPVPLDWVAPPATTYKGLPLELTDNGEPMITPVDGVIGVICVGMSNARMECDYWLERLERDLAGEVNDEVRVVNCAVDSHAIEKWSAPEFYQPLWGDCLDNKIPNAGLRPEQVRVIYHKAGSQATLGDDGRPLPAYPAPESDYFNFYANLSAFADTAVEALPSVTAIYTTSRAYGGFSDRPERGEPIGYEEGHALNQWLAANPNPHGVWHGWGAYIWAPDCASGDTNGSGVCYVASDFQLDGIHPASGAKAKISDMLQDRLSQHDWYASGSTEDSQ